MLHEIGGTDTVFKDHSVSKETIMHLLVLPRVDLSHACLDCVRARGSIACICGRI